MPAADPIDPSRHAVEPANELSPGDSRAAVPDRADVTETKASEPDEAKRSHTLTGDIRFHENMPSRLLKQPHDVLVYLPPRYEKEPERRYPVLYLHDGQNLFDNATAFSQEWGVDETAERLIAEGVIEPLIIVAMYNAGEQRLDEYTPIRDGSMPGGGKGEAHGRMLVEELKPFIDATYRTRPDAASTGVGGSSLGGLVSLYLGLRHSGVFWRLAVISPSGRNTGLSWASFSAVVPSRGPSSADTTVPSGRVSGVISFSK